MTTIEELRAEVEAITSRAVPDEKFVPPEGWHNIDVGTGFNLEMSSASLGLWLRLYKLYAENRKGCLYWKEPLRFEKEKRIITGKFCIA